MRATALPARLLRCSARHWEQRHDGTSSTTGQALGIAEVDHHRCGTEPVRLVTNIQDSDGEPDTSDCLGKMIQIPPDVSADQETSQRQQRILNQSPLHALPLSEHSELPEAREIDSGECEEGAEVEQFARMLVRIADVIEQLGPRKRHPANQQNVVHRSAGTRFEPAKKFSWQYSVAAHTEEQAGRSEGSGKPAAKRGDNQDHSHCVKEDAAANAPADIHKSRSLFRKRSPIGPYARSQVGLNPAAEKIVPPIPVRHRET